MPQFETAKMPGQGVCFRAYLDSISRITVGAPDPTGGSHASLSQGSIAYLDLLNAQQAQAQAVSNLQQARANYLADTAALFVAPGGGWWNRPDHAR